MSKISIIPETQSKRTIFCIENKTATFSVCLGDAEKLPDYSL